MADITASMVKDLREKTGAGMMECKKALTETNGNMDEAIDFLRKKGLSVANKKAGRVASEGLVGVAVRNTKGVLVELNSQTDFVARNEEFQTFLRNVTDVALALPDFAGTAEDVEKLKLADLNGESVGTGLTNLIAKIGENMNLRRVASITVPQGLVVSYMHTAAAPNLGKIGVLLGINSTADASALMEIGKKIAMHIAATNPAFLSIDQVDADTLAHEKAIYAEQARASGKPENIIDKMVEGRLRKFYEESVLLEQTFVMDADKKIKDVVAEAQKELGAPITLTAFVRYALGEGIEKKTEDFAEEVKKAIG